jgi:hypothetical protein
MEEDEEISMLDVEIATRKMAHGKVAGEDDMLEMTDGKGLAGCQYFYLYCFPFFCTIVCSRLQ